MGTSTEIYSIIGILILFAAAVLLFWMFRIRRNQMAERRITMFKKAFDVSEDAVFALSENNDILYANKSAVALLKLPPEYLHRPLEPMPKIRIKNAWVALDTFLQELPQTKRDNMQAFPHSSFIVETYEHSLPVNLYVDRSSLGTGKEQFCYVITVRDLTKEYECRELEHRHILTKLPNQLQAKEDLNKLFAKIHLHNKKMALVLISLDNFTQIRSILGHAQVDQIIVRFAHYLDQMAKSSSYYAYHLASNDFLISVPIVETADEVVYFCRQVQKELRTFYKINNVRFHLTASAGISIYPDSGSTLQLLDHAYKALAEAQKEGIGHVHVYERSELEKKYNELTLFNAIHEAIDKDEFEIHYQPIVRTKDQEVVAAEALIRWRHSEYGYIPPDVFIPMLEQSGFIIELGRYVLSEVLKQQKRWEVFKFKPIEVSINMSLLEIETEGFVENVSRQLIEHQVAPELIKFEITEGVAMQNEGQADRQIEELKKLGVSLALDDFGTGYTSFAYLKKFPADVLKIDKTLIDYILENEEDQRIIRAMIELGHNLGMKIVVEGIESKEMVDLIGSYGCDYMQGYYFSKPLPAYEFQEMIRR